MQHVVGMKTSGCIIVINKDPNAPIFELADYGVVGDIMEIIPKLNRAIKELDGYFTYELPTHLLGKIWKGRFRGQKQKWFLMKFIGEEGEINLKTKRPEFMEWKWINIKDLTDVVVRFKLEVYKKVQEEIVKTIKTI